jgi:sporulation protein YlmC with PRC-barrel domain
MTTQGNRADRGHIGPEGYSESTRLPALDELEGMDVRDASGEKIGTVEDAYTDESGAYARYIAVATGWFGTKRHLIPIDDVRMEQDGDERILVVPYDTERLKAGPAHGRDDEVTRRHEEDVYRHYGRTGYWDAVRARQTPPAPTPEVGRVAGTDRDAQQAEPAPTPEIAGAELEAARRRGDDPERVAVRRWGV